MNLNKFHLYVYEDRSLIIKSDDQVRKELCRNNYQGMNKHQIIAMESREAKVVQQAVGNMSIEISQKDNILVGDILNLDVEPEFRRKGYATFLRTEMIKIAREKGVSVFETTACSIEEDYFDEIELLNFYKRHFIKCGAKKVVCDDWNMTAHF
jgi:GNAT superfamily N-acetyltransferase